MGFEQLSKERLLTHLTSEYSLGIFTVIASPKSSVCLNPAVIVKRNTTPGPEVQTPRRLAQLPNHVETEALI